jgi:hypothetical protein
MQMFMIFNYFIFSYVHFNVHQLLNVVSLCSETYNTFNIKRIRLQAVEVCKRLSSLFGGWKIIYFVVLCVNKLIMLKIISNKLKYSGFITVRYTEQKTC